MSRLSQPFGSYIPPTSIETRSQLYDYPIVELNTEYYTIPCLHCLGEALTLTFWKDIQSNNETTRKSVPTLAIRFDIGKIAASFYGIECWKIFWRSINMPKLAHIYLFEGDTRDTLNGQENVFCVAVQCLDPGILDDIWSSISKNLEFQQISAYPNFDEGTDLMGEPLLFAGQIIAGHFLGSSYHCETAFETVQKEKH